MATTTTSSVAVNISGAIAAQAQILAEKALVHAVFARAERVAPNSGKQVTFRLPTKLSVATSALTEATDPLTTTLAVTDTALSAAQYGLLFEVSDLLMNTDPWPVLEMFVPLLATNYAETVDKLCQAVLIAGTNVRYANNVAARANVNVKTVIGDWDAVAATLKKNGASEILKPIGAAVGVNTYPIPRSYVSVVHPDVARDIRGLSGFINAHSYADVSSHLPGEFGMLSGPNIRFCQTPAADDGTGQVGAAGTTVYKNDATNFYVYLTCVFGQEAFAWASWTDAIYTGDDGTTGLKLTKRAGWKVTGKAGRLNENFLYRVETAASL